MSEHRHLPCAKPWGGYKGHGGEEVALGSQGGTRACTHSVLGVLEKGHCHGSSWSQRRACKVYLKIVQGLQCSVTIFELRFSLMDGRGGQERDFRLSKQSEWVRRDSLSQRIQTQCHRFFFFFFKKRKCNGWYNWKVQESFSHHYS